MRYSAVIAFILTAGISCGALCAEEKKPQGLDLVTDAVAAAVTKANALLSGNLEFTMEQDRDKYKNRDNYTENAIGERVPKSTGVK